MIPLPFSPSPPPEHPHRVQQVHPGSGLLAVRNSLGASISAPNTGQTFDHPWRPFLSGGQVTFRLGMVQSIGGDGPIEPTIKANGQDVPMSGKNGNTPTPLKLDANIAQNGISYAALAVYPDDPTGELLKTSKVEIIHTANPVSHDRTQGLEPLVLFVWNGGAVARVYAMRDFHLKYIRILPSGTASGAPKHLFL